MTSLVVDLDGTLLKSDMLVESLFAFLREHPLKFYLIFYWLFTGKAYLKYKLAEHTDIDVSTLPYDKEVLSWLNHEKSNGRNIVLATATHYKYANAISSYLGCFDQVMASSATLNLESSNKAKLLVKSFSDNGFDYAGNSKADLKVWCHARSAIIVNPDRGVLYKAKQLGNVSKVIENRPSFFKSIIKALRVHQWLKNLLIFVPIASGHHIDDFGMLFDASLAFLFFGICASSVYLLNDLLDLEDDRNHLSKCQRPFASGALDVRIGLILFPLILIFAFVGAYTLLPIEFMVVLLGYYFLTLLYSFKLKRVVLVDVVTLAILYTIRIIAGAMAINVELTFWILAFSMFIFLSLALVKRYAELYDARIKEKTNTRVRGYYTSDLEMLSSLGAASGYLSVLVLALYINESNTSVMYNNPMMIWLACPILLYWISRTWLITHRGLMHDDPVVFAAKDRVSQLIGLLFILVFLGAL